MKLTQEEIKGILKLEKEMFNGDRRAAVAAHVYTPGVVMKTGYKEPGFSDRQLISLLKSQVTKYENEQSSKKAQKRANKKNAAAKQTGTKSAATEQTATEQPGADKGGTGDEASK